MEPGFAFQIVVNGIALSATYGLIAIGLTVMFGVLRVLNFAHGELLMVGGFVTWLLFGKNHFPFPLTVVVAMLAVGGMALAMERGVFRPTRKRPFSGFIISLGVVYILQVSALAIFGPLDKPIQDVISGQVAIGGAVFSIQRLVVTFVAVSVIVFIWVLLERTRFGRAVRASIQDREAASLQGISLDKMSARVMFVAGALAGLAGAIVSMSFPVGPYMGTSLILKAFVIVIVGGMGSVGGTVFAALMFGFIDSTAQTLINPRIATLIDVGIMLAILVIRPRGLFGREGVIRA